jgi:hypothetical protein
MVCGDIGLLEAASCDAPFQRPVDLVAFARRSGSTRLKVGRDTDWRV